MSYLKVPEPKENNGFFTSFSGHPGALKEHYQFSHEPTKAEVTSFTTPKNIKSPLKSGIGLFKAHIQSFATSDNDPTAKTNTKYFTSIPEQTNIPGRISTPEFEFFQMCLLSLKMRHQGYSDVLRMDGKELFERAVEAEGVVFYKYYEWIQDQVNNIRDIQKYKRKLMK